MTAQSAFVLHSRPYRESSALVDFFTPEGRLRAVLRGARGRAGTLARPFVPLEVEFRGRGDLKAVGRLESAGLAYWLDGNALFSGMYLNELLIRLLPAEDAHPAMFEHYVATLPALAAKRPLEPILRAFEWRLLTELGYGFALDQDIAGQPVVSTALTDCFRIRAWSLSASFNPVCSTARNSWPWRKPIGKSPVRWRRRNG